MLKERFGTYQERQQLQQTAAFKQTNDVWSQQGFNRSANVGEVMKLIRHYEPQDRKDWEEYYFLYRTTVLNDFDMFADCAAAFAQAAGIEVDLAYKYIYIRVVDQTYDGYQNEQNAYQGIQKYLQHRHPQRHYLLEHGDDYCDRVYGVDLRLYLMDQGKKEIAGIQLKPQSYFYFIKKHPWQEQVNHRHHQKYVQATHAPVLYWSYEEIKNQQAPHVACAQA